MSPSTSSEGGKPPSGLFENFSEAALFRINSELLTNSHIQHALIAQRTMANHLKSNSPGLEAPAPQLEPQSAKVKTTPKKTAATRIGFAHEYKPLSKEEMLFTLEHHWERLGLKLKPADFSDHEAMTTIMRTTNGNFRLLNRLFMQIDRLLKLNHLQHITNEVVLAVRECLLIGNS